jgi:hypothetical protein
MKAKTIKSVLRKKFDDWVSSIKSEGLQKIVKENTLITGGAISSMLLGEPVNDYDVYFKNCNTAHLVAKYYVEQFKENPPTRYKNSDREVDIEAVMEDGRVKIVVKSAGIASESGNDDYQYFEQFDGDAESAQFVEDVTKDAQEAAKADQGKPKYRPVFLSTNAISLSHKMQLVIRFYGSAEEIHENYDFIHCTCSWDAKTGKLILPPKALEALLARELRYESSKYPLCSIIRTRKFLKRGWTINAGQFVKMAWELNQLDLTDISVLEDQLVGVDSAYFEQMLSLLRAKDGEKVDGAYLMQVIDQVF